MSSLLLKMFRGNGKSSLATSVINSCTSRTFGSKVSSQVTESQNELSANAEREKSNLNQVVNSPPNVASIIPFRATVNSVRARVGEFRGAMAVGKEAKD